MFVSAKSNQKFPFDLQSFRNSDILHTCVHMIAEDPSCTINTSSLTKRNQQCLDLIVCSVSLTVTSCSLTALMHCFQHTDTLILLIQSIALSLFGLPSSQVHNHSCTVIITYFHSSHRSTAPPCTHHHCFFYPLASCFLFLLYFTFGLLAVCMIYMYFAPWVQKKYYFISLCTAHCTVYGHDDNKDLFDLT